MSLGLRANLTMFSAVAIMNLINFNTILYKWLVLAF